LRFLAIHVDAFACRITERGRSKLVEPVSEPETRAEEALVVLVSVEKADEGREAEVARAATEELQSLAGRLGVKTVVLHPFAHLFGELAHPESAVRVLSDASDLLTQAGFRVIRTPFGWFHTLEIKAKGHPLSRVARIV